MSFEAFTREDIEQYQQPCVYIFVDAGEPMYVGSSVNGIARFGSKQHHVKNAPWDSVYVFWFDAEWKARLAEQVAISWLRPPLNGMVPARPIERETGNDELEKFIADYNVVEWGEPERCMSI